VEGLLAIVGLEVTTEGVRTGTGTERWRERVADFRGCSTEAVRKVVYNCITNLPHQSTPEH